jgi:hypothetical protein
MSNGPARHIDSAVQAIRQFNHASRSAGPEWQRPGDTYSAIGALSQLAGMLPQALEQSIRPVTRTHEDGRLAIDGDGDPQAAVRYLRDALAAAVKAAADVEFAVGQMHIETSPMSYDTSGPSEFEDDA